MKISKNLIGKVFTIKDVPVSNPCLNCHPCVRLRLMELGMFEGEKIKIVNHQIGLWIVNILGMNGSTVSSVALRDDELKRLFIEEPNCPVSILDLPN